MKLLPLIIHLFYYTYNDSCFIIVDCGSSGNRPYKITYVDSKSGNKTLIIDPMSSIKPPIQDIMNSIEHDITEQTLIKNDHNITDFINSTKSILSQNHCDFNSSTVYMFATAGLRNARFEKERYIFNNLSHYINNQNLHPSSIDGNQEAMFDFLTGTYMVKNSIIKNNLKTLVIDMGGASTQVAYSKSSSQCYYNLNMLTPGNVIKEFDQIKGVHNPLYPSVCIQSGSIGQEEWERGKKTNEVFTHVLSQKNNKEVIDWRDYNRILIGTFGTILNNCMGTDSAGAFVYPKCQQLLYKSGVRERYTIDGKVRYYTGMHNRIWQIVSDYFAQETELKIPKEFHDKSANTPKLLLEILYYVGIKDDMSYSVFNSDWVYGAAIHLQS